MSQLRGTLRWHCGLNPSGPAGDRLLIPYVGANTKHGSGLRHRRFLGLASVRKDGWVSLEAGRVEGTVVTKALPLERPMKLELNVDCHSGHIAAEVLPIDYSGACFEPVEGYEADKSRVEYVDCVRHEVSWADKKVVEPIKEKSCVLRMTLRQGSLFSYKWSEAK